MIIKNDKQKNKEFKILYLIVISLFILINLNSTEALINASLELNNGTAIDFLRFDRSYQTLGSNYYGSNSYMDHNPTNPNLFLNICHPNLTTGQKVDLVYLSKNRTIISSILNYLPLVTETTEYGSGNNTYNCSTIDIDISSKYAIYPGYIYPIIIPIGVNYSRDSYNLSQLYLLPQLNQFLNGSFEMSIKIAGPPKKYLISTQSVFDENETAIVGNEKYLVTSVLNSSNGSLAEGLLSPGEALEYSGNFLGGEKVYVNDILSLEMILYDPCTPLNVSGYYLMNDSVWNTNQTCIVVKDTDNIIINFGGEVIDGDNNTNGSMAENECPINIVNSDNVTIENLRSQQFYYGLCISNSSVTVYGTGSVSNLHGAIVDKNSSVTFSGVEFSNNNSEIIAVNDSVVTLLNTNFSTASLDSKFSNVMAKSVALQPDPPNITGILDIDQFVEFNAYNSNAYVDLNFSYSLPLPNNVSVDNASVYEYNGTYGSYCLESAFNATSNSTYNRSVNCWAYGNWTKLFTYISPSEQLIVVPNRITNFSVYAPFAFKTNTTIPEPNPQPQPNPNPTPKSGSGGSSGGTPSKIYEDNNEVPASPEPEPLLLELDLPDNITLMQGEAEEVFFNITNKGDFDVDNLSVGPIVQAGWDYTNITIGSLLSNQTKNDKFEIAPYEKSLPGTYMVPVLVYLTDGNSVKKVTTELLKVIVLPRGNLQRIKILEYPPEIIAEPFSKVKVSFFAENIGDQNLDNITIKLSESECLMGVEGSNSLNRGEKNSITYLFTFGEKSKCKYNIKFYNNEKLVGFLPIKFVVKNKIVPWTDHPVKASIMILIILAWTALTVHIVSRRRHIIK